MANLIKVDGSIATVKPKNGTDFKLSELQELVGGYIQVISVNDDMLLVIDEEGKLKNSPFNPLATNIAKGFVRDDDFIVGNALHCKSSEVE